MGDVGCWLRSCAAGVEYIRSVGMYGVCLL